jgi:hypothetical protein
MRYAGSHSVATTHRSGDRAPLRLGRLELEAAALAARQGGHLHASTSGAWTNSAKPSRHSMISLSGPARRGGRCRTSVGPSSPPRATSLAEHAAHSLNEPAAQLPAVISHA